MYHRALPSTVLSLLTTAVLANNIQVSNVQLTGQNATNNTYQVTFDLSWENSWRLSTGPSNWDAAWVFVKFSKLDFDVWNHAKLELTGGVAPSGSVVQVSANSDALTVGMGAFIYRAADGSGNVNWSNVQLRWNYGLDGIADNDPVEVTVIAIEMVYVPQGAFYLGDGSGMIGSFEDGSGGLPFQVTTDNTAFTLGTGASGGIGNNNSSQGGNQLSLDDFNDAVGQTLPAAFPAGFNAFYCMKYEISQGQYATFLSLLTATQSAARFATGGAPLGFAIASNGTRYDASAPSNTCTYLGWADVAAYLDWSGLRPMSEMEFEKACRGTRYAVPREFAWGNASTSGTSYGNAQNPNTDQSLYVNLPQNIGNIQGLPYNRNGMVAASSVNHTREETGGSYYGIMELSGGTTEYCVTVGNANGRLYDGRHGDGAIQASGVFNVVNWPLSTAGATGMGIRGGSSAYFSSDDRRTSGRYRANEQNLTRQEAYGGGHGVRTP
jgi:formylglycine-generating enzyme required for sulfatase activity